MDRSDAWAKPDQQLSRWIDEHRRRAIDAYSANPLLVDEHGRQEDSFRTGGYAHRQVLELVQNAADALARARQRGRIEVVLHEGALYCANEGSPFNQSGLEAVTHAYLGDKRGDEIGRFGLGFKSLLGIADSVTVLSRSVSFAFLEDRSRDALQGIAPSVHSFPILRLPHVVKPQTAIEADPILRELSEWAVTIIKVQVVRDMARLVDALKTFPRPFLLFVAGVSELVIKVDEDVPLVFRSEKMDKHRWRLFDGDDQSTDYVVFRQNHRPSEEALAEVGEAIRRPEVPVTYAAPLDDTQTRGEFWAYFPLQDVTSARGIHNAPWRINDDRTNLLDGKFNDELLSVLADLIVQALPYLRTEGDPARHFDYLPARGREATYTADKRLTELVPERASVTACVPDAEGSLKVSEVLKYPNLDLRLDLESVQLWDRTPGRPILSPHWTCFKTNTRRARLRSLIRPDENRASQVEMAGAEWLQALVRDATDEQCDCALQVYSSLSDESTRAQMMNAAVIPDTDGWLTGLDATEELFLRGNLLSEMAGLRLVRQSFLEREHVEERLRSFGFKDVDPKYELERLATQVGHRWGDYEWRAFWKLVDQVSIDDAERILTEHLKTGLILKVLSADKSWQPVGRVVVPGIVNPSKSSLALNTGFHERHLGLLRAIGVAERPVVTSTALDDPTLLEYLRICRDIYVKRIEGAARPDPSAIRFVEAEALGPLYLLRCFEDEDDIASLTLWTRELLEAETAESFTLQQVPEGRRAVLAPQQVRAPHLWAADRYGRIESSWGPRRASETLQYGLVEYSRLLPVASWAASAKIPTIDSLESIPVDLWREFLGRCPGGGDPFTLGSLLAKALRVLPHWEVPDRVPAVSSTGWDLVPTGDLLIATNDDECRALRREGLPFAATRNDEDASALATAWRCSLAATVLSIEIVTEGVGEPALLLDRFPGLRSYATGDFDDVEIVECTSVQQVVSLPGGTDSQYVEVEQCGRTIYYENTYSDEELIGWISAKFGLNISPLDIQQILSAAQDLRIKERIATCRAENEPARKLLALLPVDVLELRLPTGLLTSLRELAPGEGDDVEVAELLLLVHGLNVLAEMRKELSDAGYSVPDQWAGSAPAVAFVRSLGFAAEFAGERNQGLDPAFVVLGPPNLDDLHPYQSALAEDIRELVRNRDEPGRALLFLPTGAGKTRVTVEALTYSLISGETPGPLLWIAQSEELCEQAVQTWSTVWRQFGDRPLRICRLWRNHEVARSDSDATVVVATDAKLEKVRDREDYDWVRDVTAVIIDEAHGATTPGITETLRWLGVEGRKTARPLLGLTATPFRGRGADQNERLARRFGNRLLKIDTDDPYAELQRLGVLATVEHRILRHGSKFSLDEDEVEKFNTFKDLPNSVLERVGKDHQRTVTLLEDIEGLPNEWPVLVFTSSVLSAQVLSALLRVRGTRSDTVSGSTRTRERRRIIERFRAGEIQVLTNCNLLTQGFDAPAVRALYVARPTFSPNAYIQMVGRGLRGPLNGGKEECLIVNVDDTFQQFGSSLAFKDFDYLWREHGKKFA